MDRLRGERDARQHLLRVELDVLRVHGGRLHLNLRGVVHHWHLADVGMHTHWWLELRHENLRRGVETSRLHAELLRRVRYAEIRLRRAARPQLWVHGREVRLNEGPGGQRIALG